MSEPILLASNGWLFFNKIREHDQIIQDSGLSGVEYSARFSKNRLAEVLNHTFSNGVYRSLHLPHNITSSGSFFNPTDYFEICALLLYRINPEYAVLHPQNISSSIWERLLSIPRLEDRTFSNKNYVIAVENLEPEIEEWNNLKKYEEILTSHPELRFVIDIQHAVRMSEKVGSSYLDDLLALTKERIVGYHVSSFPPDSNLHVMLHDYPNVQIEEFLQKCYKKKQAPIVLEGEPVDVSSSTGIIKNYEKEVKYIRNLLSSKN